ncbi:MAG: hypothetical protein MMC33_002221 [Icmadophila ericetorum]|nr:hypothetical protein [Icmadophila ericetorum]
MDQPRDLKLSDNSIAYDKVLQDIATYVFHYEISSSQALNRARLALCDALGCAVETLSISSDVHHLIGPFIPGTIVPDGFRLVGTSHQLDPVKGAFDLGTLIRYLDHNDAYPGAEWGHPSDNLGAIIPVMDWLSRTHASKALPDAGPPLTLRTLLHALIKAYEIQGCFQIRNAFNLVGLDHTILVKVASTAVVSWILGLSEVQTLSALSQAWQDGHPLRTFRQSPNTGPRKGWAAGDACMRAVHLALLTRAGQPGSPTVLTTPKWGFYGVLFRDKEFVLPRPYGTWVIENVFFKLIVAEGHGISAIEATLQLLERIDKRGLKADQDIASIKVRTHGPACTIIDKSGPLSNAADRDHCLQYMISVTLLKGSVIEATDYLDTSPWASDRRVEDLRAKIQMFEDQRFTADYHDQKVRSAASGVTIRLTTGEQFEEVVVEHPVGHPWRPDTSEKVSDKFRRNMGSMFPEQRVDEILVAVEDLDLPVCKFVDLFSI